MCRPKCSECGGYNVETTAWIEYREDGTEKIVNTEGPLFNEEGNWCHDCDAHVDLDYPESYTPQDDQLRQMNNAAREHGPELLAALGALLADPNGKKATYAATQLVERLTAVVSR